MKSCLSLSLITVHLFLSFHVCHERLLSGPNAKCGMSCSGMSEDMEEGWDELTEEIIVEVPVVEAGSYYYVCSECGCDLTEIPYYNRYYCENCGLHY